MNDRLIKLKHTLLNLVLLAAEEASFFFAFALRFLTSLVEELTLDSLERRPGVA